MTTDRQFEPVKTVRLYQRIVTQVEDAVARGDLKPGSRLPSERELVAQFGTSRATVREALRVLESNGVIRSRPGDPNGPEVLPFTPVVLQKQLRRMLLTQGLNMATLISFRMILDGWGGQLTAELHTPEELQTLELSILSMERSIEDGFDAFSEADLAFHDAVADASRTTIIAICNDVVRALVVSLISEKVRTAHDSFELMQENLKHHREVLEAVRARDGQAAMRISSRNLYDYYAEYVNEEDRKILLAMLHPDDRGSRS